MKRSLLFILFISVIVLNGRSQTAGNTLNFDGSNDYVSCPLPSVFNSMGTNDFTVELWITPTIGAFQRVMFAQFDANNFASISLNASGEVVFYIRQNGGNFSLQSQDVLNSTELVHIAITWLAANNDARIYINGNEANYATGIFDSSIATDGSMAIGAKTDGAQVFTGDIDELAIWSIAKSQCELNFEMNDKKEGTETNLVTYYNFDQGASGGANPGIDELHDATAAGNDGTLMNFALSGNTSNWTTSLVETYRWWGEQSPLLVGQLGLVATVNANSYQWINCSDQTPVSGATNATFDPVTEDPNYSGEGDFYAVISTSDNCVDTSACYNVNGFGLSIAEEEMNTAVSVFPNPSRGNVTVESLVNMESIEIRTVSGQVIQTIKPIQLHAVQLDLSEKSGVYFVTVYSESGTVTKKVVVQNL